MAVRLQGSRAIDGFCAIDQGDVDEMMAKHLGALFMPHGLGHMLGTS
jgi:hypothetical protein